jgi:hypothetical protein
VSVVPPPPLPSVNASVSPMTGWVLVGNSQTLPATSINTTDASIVRRVNGVPAGSASANPACQAALAAGIATWRDRNYRSARGGRKRRSRRKDSLAPLGSRLFLVFQPRLPAAIQPRTLWLAFPQSLRSACCEQELHGAYAPGFARRFAAAVDVRLGLSLFSERRTTKSNRPRGGPGPVEGAAARYVLLSWQKKLCKARGVHVAEERRARRQQ